MDWGLAILLALVSVAVWWLSGYDSRVTGESRWADLKRRAVRCGTTLLLLALGFGAAAGLGRFGGSLCIAIIVPLALMWTGCVSELFARAFHHLIDSPDSREFDSNELTRDLDRLAQLVQQGRNQEAIELCARLRESAATSAMGLEATLCGIYDNLFEGSCLTSPALAAVQKMYEEGHCLLAESRLNEILKEEPGNLTAAVMLMKLYARNQRDRDRALSLLHAVEQRRAVPAGFGDYARRRIDEWLDPNSQRKRSNDGIESVLVDKKHRVPLLEVTEAGGGSIADLLKSGQLGTAIELLEKDVRRCPHNFDTRLQLAEAYGLYCCNISRATEIVTRIENNPTFTAEQIRRAKEKLREWREASPSVV